MFKYIVLLCVIAIAGENGVKVPGYLIPLIVLAIVISFITAVMISTVDRLQHKQENK